MFGLGIMTAFFIVMVDVLMSRPVFQARAISACGISGGSPSAIRNRLTHIGSVAKGIANNGDAKVAEADVHCVFG